jgi:hypothetical protein
MKTGAALLRTGKASDIENPPFFENPIPNPNP